MGLHMLTVNLRQTSHGGEIHGRIRQNCTTCESSPLAENSRPFLAGWRSTPSFSLSRFENSPSFPHKFNNLVVRKYRPVSPVFARRSRRCSPRAASIDKLSSRKRLDEIAVLFHSPKPRRAAEIIALARATIPR